jgi:CTP:phosphocholine cytidylyltransferase-like protein/thiamine kinase-like enzyme
MNTLALLCREIALDQHFSQRQLAQKLNVSLGKVNQLIKEAETLDYLVTTPKKYSLSKQGRAFLDQFRVDNAIILAAGFGSRFVPFTYEAPKGLLEVKGVPMLERQIEQLLEKGITEIIIVVGYLKEKFDYLIDKYGVKLIYNPEFAEKNNYVSLYCALDYLKRSYILMGDHWMEHNIFNTWEPESWFSCVFFEGNTLEWSVTTDKQGRINRLEAGGYDAWTIMGPAFFNENSSRLLGDFIRASYQKPGTENYYWEDVLREHLDVIPLYINKQSGDDVHEFETLEELRRYDTSYLLNSQNATMQKIASVFGIEEHHISNIVPLKNGMTNDSFVFRVDKEDYVFRVPGRGTAELIDRKQEKAAYDAIADLDVGDEIISFDAESGTKISRFYKNARAADIQNEDDLRASAQIIRNVHTSGASTSYAFDIRKMVDHYIALAQEHGAIRFSDFSEVDARMRELLSLKDQWGIQPVLCHGDHNPTNTLIFPDGSCRLIDWEYCGMADPLLDIALFGIYASMDRLALEHYLNIYLERDARNDERARLYLYTALGGYLWSIWSEYKQAIGQEFGEYPLLMYRYAKDFDRILRNEGYLSAYA